jgi:hypothetical protein
MSLIAPICLAADRHDRAPFNDSLNPHAAPDRINRAKVFDNAQATLDR